MYGNTEMEHGVSWAREIGSGVFCVCVLLRFFCLFLTEIEVSHLNSC